MREDKTAQWHHQLNGHESEQAPQNSEGEGGLARCRPWGHRTSDTTERLNHNRSPSLVEPPARGLCLGPRSSASLPQTSGPLPTWRRQGNRGHTLGRCSDGAQEGAAGLQAASESTVTPPDAPCFSQVPWMLLHVVDAPGWVWEDAGCLGVTKFLGRNMAPIPAPPLSQGNQKWGPAARHSKPIKRPGWWKGEFDFGCWQPGVGARCLFKG